MQSKLLLAIAICALPVGGGCSAPWVTPFSRSDAGRNKAPSANVAHGSSGPPRAGSFQPTTTANPPVDLQLEHGATTPDLTGVLDNLQQVRQIDPAAEQKFLEALRRTPPDSWPLVAEQFRASLAYHQTLTASDQTMMREGGASAEPSLSSLGDSAAPSPARPPAIGRPSAPIGDLVDPRRTGVDGVSSEALAQATPYSMPAPDADEVAKPMPPANVVLAEFSHDGPLDSTASRTADENWQELLERAADDLSRRVAKSPSTTAEVHQHVSLRVLRLLAGDTQRALEPIPHISPTEHDYWSRQIFALATYLDHHSQPDDKRRAAASVTHLDEAVAHLRELGSLSVRNLSFCKNVYGYGAIEPYDADRFSPGEHVSLYVEVENYHSESTEKGYCTLLGSSYEILNDQDERVGGGDIPDVNDCCRSRRRDFHIQYGLALPQKLPPGQYRLQLVIKDRQSDKMGHATAAFEIKGAAP